MSSFLKKITSIANNAWRWQSGVSVEEVVGHQNEIGSNQCVTPPPSSCGSNTPINQLVPPPPPSADSSQVLQESSGPKKTKKRKRSVFYDELIKEGFTDTQATSIVFAKRGYNLFITGGGGTGKSHTLRKIAEVLRKDGKNVAVTSSTGVSALNVGGVTLHRFLGIGYGRTVEEIKKNSSYKVNNWVSLGCLILDEISMLDRDLLDNIDSVARLYRKCDKPFGGIQVLVFGDFLQLQPCFKIGGAYSKGVYAFESVLFKEGIHFFINLGKVHRQKDNTFVQILNNVRVGKFDDWTTNMLRSRIIHVDEEYWRNIRKADEIPTYITSSNKEADSINERFFSTLKGKIFGFSCYDFCSKNSSDVRYILNDTGVPEKLKFRKNARVVLTYNLDDEYVNGSRGTVSFTKKISSKSLSSFCLDNGCSTFMLQGINSFFGRNDIVVPAVTFDGKEEIKYIFPVKFSVTIGESTYSRVQYPLKLAWALTTHKLQGWELDCGSIAEKTMGLEGQFYSAIARVRSLEGLSLLSFDPAYVSCSDDALNWMKKTFGEDFSSSCIIEKSIFHRNLPINIPRRFRKKRKIKNNCRRKQ